MEFYIAYILGYKTRAEYYVILCIQKIMLWCYDAMQCYIVVPDIADAGQLPVVIQCNMGNVGPNSWKREISDLHWNQKHQHYLATSKYVSPAVTLKFVLVSKRCWNLMCRMG
jgi:hypothetical protein